MKTEPQKEHQWLQTLVGEWTYESECSMEPGKPPEKFKGSESVRSLGGLWVQCESRGEMPGAGMATMLMTLGHDPQKKQYVGTWEMAPIHDDELSAEDVVAAAFRRAKRIAESKEKSR